MIAQGPYLNDLDATDHAKMYVDDYCTTYNMYPSECQQSALDGGISLQVDLLVFLQAMVNKDPTHMHTHNNISAVNVFFGGGGGEAAACLSEEYQARHC